MQSQQFKRAAQNLQPGGVNNATDMKQDGDVQMNGGPPQPGGSLSNPGLPNSFSNVGMGGMGGNGGQGSQLGGMGGVAGMGIKEGESHG